MEKQLIEVCSKKVGFVMSDERLRRWIDEINIKRKEIKRDNPRSKSVDVIVHYGFRGTAMINEIDCILIGDSRIDIDRVKGEEL